MTAPLATRQDTKTLLLEAGIELMNEKGYSNTGIQEILQRVGVPKGSFYHYFESKEDFALQIIEHHQLNCRAKLERTLKNTELSPLARLREYCELGKRDLEASNCRKGCLIGNLSQEMADQSERLRAALSGVMALWRDNFTTCIAEGQKAGEISQAWPAAKMAELFICGWEGAIMRAKSSKTLDPLNLFIELMFNHILLSKTLCDAA
jgi:TetR/AcrR family transcriptional regulator, transcriptional repressor for nem operon